MATSLDAQQVLDREFLEIRGKILEIASSLDRLQRAAGTVDQDERFQRLQQGLQILLDPAGQDEPSRAKQIQLLFSREYEENWRQQYQL
ncbi:MAG: hypothetical protein VX738_16915 [Planctomycetota bacterium]|nr:hypothetical protein [Planctomycetota bacterium]